jgi:hypothetical protein
MRPTSAELMTRISDALDTTVLPAIKDDKWAASVVRSAMTLLAHLAKRVELEGPMLVADNQDADTTLQECTDVLNKHGLHARIEAIRTGTAIAAFDTVALDARNREYQGIVESALRALYGSSDISEKKARDRLLAYLRRRVGRERDIYFPAFTGPPF